MTSLNHTMPNTIWKNKAISFVVRTRQDLWGKHNEDILAWFFLEGFNNTFIRDMLLGWNKFAKNRPSKAWGLPDECLSQGIHQGKFILPPGIVIPHIVNKDLRKILIYDHLNKDSKRCVPVPGSSSDPIILGDSRTNVAVFSNIIHGLFIYQELKKDVTIIIPHTSREIPDSNSCVLIRQAEHRWIFPDPLAQGTDHALESWTHIAQETRWTPYEKVADLLNIITPK